MRWSTLVVAVLVVASPAGAAETLPAPAVRVQLRSEAMVPDDVLDASRQEAARVFARAGFQVLWTDEQPRFTVTIVADVLGFARAASPIMGGVLPTTNGPIVHVFLRQVGAFARTYHVDLAAVLGHVIAHEAGHVLLATASHSSTGVMRGEWDAAQMRNVARGALTFTDGQAQRIRAAVSHSR